MKGDAYGQWWKHARPGRVGKLGVRTRSHRKKRKGLSAYNLRALTQRIFTPGGVGESGRSEITGGMAGPPHERKRTFLSRVASRISGMFARARRAVA
jgi:hypothetical protein